MSCWEDKDGLSDASVNVLLFLGGGRAEGSLIFNNVLLPSNLLGNILDSGGEVEIECDSVFGSMTWD